MKTSSLFYQPTYSYEQPKSLLQHFLKALSGHVGLLICVVVFASVGAYIFIRIELPAEEHRFLVQRLKAKDIEDTMAYISQLFWFEKDQNLTFHQWDQKVRKNLMVMEDQVVVAVKEHRYDSKASTWNYDWTFSKAVLFTSSVLTTIGYGHIAPVTSSGQVFTICYGMIGMPLMLVFLARIGDGMATGFTRIYSRLCCLWCRGRRYKSEAIFGKKAKRTWEDVVGDEEYMPTKKVAVPISILLVVLLLYLLLGAQIFSSWEGWTFVTACYFSFVTLATIGFGDLVPGNSFLDYGDGLRPTWMMLATIAYCLVGMALISMCIQMVQQQAARKMRWVAEELGLVEDHQRPRVRYRRTRRGAVPETPRYTGSRSRPSTGQESQPGRSRPRVGTTAGPPTTPPREAEASSRMDGNGKGEEMEKTKVRRKTGLKEEMDGDKEMNLDVFEKGEMKNQVELERILEEEMDRDLGTTSESGFLAE